MAYSQRKSYNLFDKTATDTDKGYLNNQRLNLTTIENSSNVAISEYISVDTSAAYYTLSGILTSGQYNASLAFYDSQYNPIQGYRYQGLASIRVQVPENAAYLRFTIIKANIDEIMLLKGYYATAEIPPYKPYGWVHSLRKLTTATETVENPLYSDGTTITAYTIKGNTVQNGTPTPTNPVDVQGVGTLDGGQYKIPISNGQQTIDIYIGDLPLLKSLDGTAVDEISNGMLTRRVDADGSVLPTPTTTQITMPSIPTTQGANLITVDTTVQPSAFSATWSGWHNAYVKEKSENLFDKDNAERYEYGLGNNNTVGFANHAAMFCFEAEPNTNYSAKVYGTANTFLRLYRSDNALIKPERQEIEYDSMVEQSSTQYPEVTINSGNCQYIWLQVSGSWYDTYGGDTIMLNSGSTALPYEPYWK